MALHAKNADVNAQREALDEFCRGLVLGEGCKDMESEEGMWRPTSFDGHA